MKKEWTSQGMYEHPAKHQAGVFGNVVLSPAGVYALRVGSSTMSCPQDWAAGIHAEETGQTGSMIIRKVPEDLRRKFKALCAAEGASIQDKIIALMREAVAPEGEKGDGR
jgi:hypothetical protein